MIVLEEEGGVRVFGHSAEVWKDSSRRNIAGHAVVFDSDTYEPDVDTGDFLLPAHRGQYDYQIHLLETGAALILKEDFLYICLSRDGMPLVITNIPVPADRGLISFVSNR